MPAASQVQRIDVNATAPGSSQQVATSITSAQTQALNSTCVLVHVTVPTFMRVGSNPIALADGTDQYLAANTPYRIAITRGNLIAFILPTGTGTAYITPGG